MLKFLLADYVRTEAGLFYWYYPPNQVQLQNLMDNGNNARLKPPPFGLVM